MRITRLLTVLALLGFSLACMGIDDKEPVPVTEPEPVPPVGGPADGPAERSAWDHYAESRYDYCDATVLAGMWGDSDPAEAKEFIGQLLRDGDGDTLDSKLSFARQNAHQNFSNRSLRCHYDMIGFSYEDAVTLSELWGLDTWEAKMQIELKYLLDDHSDVNIRAALAEARGAADLGQHSAIDVYIQSEYEYCDARVLGGMWGVDTYDAKLKIGNHILGGSGEELSSILRSAQLSAADRMSEHHLRCSYEEIGYSYSDADVLASYWEIETYEAKLRIEEKYLRDGHSRTHIDDALRLARQ